MLIDCPTCSTQYDVPERRLRPQLRLRCSRCATEWGVADGTPAASELDEARFVPEPAAPNLVARNLVRPGARLTAERDVHQAARPYGLVSAWIFSFVILVAGGWAAIHWRAPIMQGWPPATRAYAAVGLLDGSHARPRQD